MASENGRRLLVMLLDEHSAVAGETNTVAEARAILAGQEVAAVRRDIAARLDRAADHNDGGFKRVLHLLARRVRDGKENADR